MKKKKLSKNRIMRKLSSQISTAVNLWSVIIAYYKKASQSNPHKFQVQIKKKRKKRPSAPKFMS